MKKLLFLLLLSSQLLLAQKKFTITVHEIADPDGMNPITSTSANGLYMQGNVFQKLLDFDPQTLALQPVLAKALPTVSIPTEGKYQGGMAISYEIHPQATWDNGQPITAEDYLFTIKAIKNPKVNAFYLRKYFAFIEAIEIDPSNAKRFTIYSSKPHYRGVETSGAETFVLPKYHYDPDNLLDHFSLEELNKEEQLETLIKDPQLIAFAKAFNSPDFAREPDQVVGSGPYQLKNWTIGQVVEFEKKENWWGNNIKNNPLLAAYPTTIQYLIESGFFYDMEAYKETSMDIIRSLPPQKFKKLKKNKAFNKQYTLATTPQFAYHYLGLNTKNPKLQDVLVRKAIAHAVDKKAILNSIFGGLALPANGPISPVKEYYNKNLETIELDLEKAKQYLQEAGWTDSDGNGILDKQIDGQLEQLSLTFLYNQGNTIRRDIGTQLKANLQQLKIDLQLEPVEFFTLLDRANQQDFEIMALAWVKTPGLDDMRQVWHSSALGQGGSNRVGFEDTAADQLIEAIEVTLEEDKRKELYMELQEKIVASHSYVFLAIPKERLAISKKFNYPALSTLRPGYVARFFQKKG